MTTIRPLIATVVTAWLLAAAACTGDTPVVESPAPPSLPPPSEEPVPCPRLDPEARIGQVGGEGADQDLTVQGISGLGVATNPEPDDPERSTPIAWAVGDRSANELGGKDTVLLFALDPRTGEVISRHPLDASSLEPDANGDPVTSLEDSEDALPDFEDLGIEPGTDGTNRMWLFDTGNNNGNRDHLNAYVLDAPEPSAGRRGRSVEAIRYPFQLDGNPEFPALNIEAAVTDPQRGQTPVTVYLIPKSPVDVDDDGSEFAVFAFEPDLDDPTSKMNTASMVGRIALDDPSLIVTAASVSQDGTAFAIRAVSGGEEGQPNLDLVGLWQRDPTTSLTEMLEARPSPECTWAFDTAKGSSSEETLAFNIRNGSRWSGFLWTHDQPEPGAPLFAAARR